MCCALGANRIITRVCHVFTINECTCTVYVINLYAVEIVREIVHVEANEVALAVTT